MNDGTPLYGCIEAGGTKFIAGIVGGPDDIRATHRVETTRPDETIGATLRWMRDQTDQYGSLAAIGIASFGPAGIDRAAPDWGYITRTTKPGWTNARFAGVFADAFGVPVGFDTDVNGAALSEYRWGAGKGHRSSVYLTIGTGIGGGAIIDGALLKGLNHPEMGHIRPPLHPLDTGFDGTCPFHGACLEGLASGPSVKARWGYSLSELPADHPGHEIIAWYLGHAVITMQAMMEPARIILGGGVMHTPGLIERVRSEAERLDSRFFVGKASEIVVRPGLGDHAGLLGALALAQDALLLPRV